jgi:hypothetical protein
LCVVDSVLTFKLEHSFKHATSRGDENVANHEIPREDMSFDTVVYEFETDMNEFDGELLHSVAHDVIPSITN